MKWWSLTVAALGAAEMTVPASAQIDCAVRSYQLDTAVTGPSLGSFTVQLFVPDDPGCETIQDLNVNMIVRHQWQGAVSTTLTAPQGQEIVLFHRPGVPPSSFGFSSDNYGNPMLGDKFILDDQAPNPYDVPFVAEPGINNVVGPWKPENPINAVLAGTMKSGIWRLTVTNHTGAFAASTLMNFGLVFTNVPEPAVVGLLGYGAFQYYVYRHTRRRGRSGRGTELN